MRTESLFVFISLTLAACAHPQPVVASQTSTTAVEPVASEQGLAFDVLPADTELVVDGKSYGPLSGMTLANGVLALEPGVYQVSLKHPGFDTWRAEVAVGKKVERVKVQLLKR